MNDASQASLYGRGIFTTVAVFRGQPFLWEKHWRRLNKNATAIGLDLGRHSPESVGQAIADAIEHEDLINGRVRITFFDERPSPVWPNAQANGETGLTVIIAGSRHVPEELRLTVSPYPANSRSPLAGVKSCNYLENILAIEEAKGRGFDEAVRLNERGAVTSGCMVNVFWLKDGRLFTPALSTGCLPGTTREFVLENVECDEVEVRIGEIENADAVFLTSAGLGVVAVNEFKGRALTVNNHPILRLIEENT